MKSQSTTYETIILAANKLILGEGMEGFTLEAVAREAGVSKGGLLYHFPHKEALLEGILEYLLDRFDDELNRQLNKERPGPGRWTRAYIHATLTPELAWLDNCPSVLAAIANDMRLLSRMREQHTVWQQHLESDGIDPVKANLVRLTLDGLLISDLFRFAPLEGKLRQGVIAALVELAGGPDSGQRPSAAQQS